MQRVKVPTQGQVPHSILLTTHRRAALAPFCEPSRPLRGPRQSGFGHFAALKTRKGDLPLLFIKPRDLYLLGRKAFPTPNLNGDFGIDL